MFETKEKKQKKFKNKKTILLNSAFNSIKIV